MGSLVSDFFLKKSVSTAVDCNVVCSVWEGNSDTKADEVDREEGTAQATCTNLEASGNQNSCQAACGAQKKDTHGAFLSASGVLEENEGKELGETM